MWEVNSDLWHWRVGDRHPGGFGDDAEHFGKSPSYGCALRPPREELGDGVEEEDTGGGIDDDGGPADVGEGGSDPFGGRPQRVRLGDRQDWGARSVGSLVQQDGDEEVRGFDPAE